MNKELIEIQKYDNSSAIIILNEYINKLGYVLAMDANIKDEYLFASPYGNPIFRNQLDDISKKSDLIYFVIRNISEIDETLQNRYIGIIKDREFLGYNLPNNVIIVFTIDKEEDLKKISKDLYHFCTVSF